MAPEALQLRLSLQGEPEAVVVLSAPPALLILAQIGAAGEVTQARHLDRSLRLASVVLVIVTKIRGRADAE